MLLRCTVASVFLLLGIVYAAENSTSTSTTTVIVSNFNATTNIPELNNSKAKEGVGKGYGHGGGRDYGGREYGGRHEHHGRHELYPIFPGVKPYFDTYYCSVHGSFALGYNEKVEGYSHGDRYGRHGDDYGRKNEGYDRQNNYGGGERRGYGDEGRRGGYGEGERRGYGEERRGYGEGERRGYGDEGRRGYGDEGRRGGYGEGERRGYEGERGGYGEERRGYGEERHGHGYGGGDYAPARFVRKITRQYCRYTAAWSHKACSFCCRVVARSKYTSPDDITAAIFTFDPADPSSDGAGVEIPDYKDHGSHGYGHSGGSYRDDSGTAVANEQPAYGNQQSAQPPANAAAQSYGAAQPSADYSAQPAPQAASAPTAPATYGSEPAPATYGGANPSYRSKRGADNYESSSNGGYEERDGYKSDYSNRGVNQCVCCAPKQRYY